MTPRSRPTASTRCSSGSRRGATTCPRIRRWCASRRPTSTAAGLPGSAESVDAATDAEAAVTPVADCTVRAPASDLDLLLWNRRHPATEQVVGDPSVLDVWRGAVRIRGSE